MSYIEWSADLELGNALMDRDHRRLVETLNRLVDLLVAQSESSVPSEHRDAILEAFDDLMSETAEHFGRETAMMAEHGFPGLAAHQNEHVALLSQLSTASSCRDRLLTPGQISLTARYWREWFESHIRHSDRKLAEWLATNLQHSK